VEVQIASACVCYTNITKMLSMYFMCKVSETVGLTYLINIIYNNQRLDVGNQTQGMLMCPTTAILQMTRKN
jgi:hypothetical protein